MDAVLLDLFFQYLYKANRLVQALRQTDRILQAPVGTDDPDQLSFRVDRRCTDEDIGTRLRLMLFIGNLLFRLQDLRIDRIRKKFRQILPDDLLIGNLVDLLDRKIPYAHHALFITNTDPFLDRIKSLCDHQVSFFHPHEIIRNQTPHIEATHRLAFPSEQRHSLHTRLDHMVDRFCQCQFRIQLDYKMTLLLLWVYFSNIFMHISLRHQSLHKIAFSRFVV